MTHSDISKLQPSAWSVLSRSYQAGRIAGTYLFHGPDGCGHWLTAISLAALVNCADPMRAGNKGEMLIPCSECRNCRAVFGLNFEGMLFALPLPPHKNESEALEFTNQILQAKRDEPFSLSSFSGSINIPIASAREIGRRLSRKGTAEITRVALFYRMELMKTASADALLKLIEEPPRDTIIIMTAARPESLLPTIQSRAQKIRLGRTPEQELAGYLIRRYNLSESKATLFSKLSEGLPGKAVEMAGEDHGDESSRRAVGFMLFRSLLTEEAAELLSHFNELLNARDRRQTEHLLVLWQSFLRDCAHYANGGDDDDIVNLDYAVELKKLSVAITSASVLTGMIECIKITLADLRRNVHIQGALAALALKMRLCRLT